MAEERYKYYLPQETGIRHLLNLLGVSDIDKVMELWQEEEDERAGNAEKLAAQFSQNGDGGQGDEQEEREAVWNRQVKAVNNLLVDLREVVGNGQ